MIEKTRKPNFANNKEALVLNRLHSTEVHISQVPTVSRKVDRVSSMVDMVSKVVMDSNQSDMGNRARMDSSKGAMDKLLVGMVSSKVVTEDLHRDNQAKVAILLSKAVVMGPLPLPHHDINDVCSSFELSSKATEAKRKCHSPNLQSGLVSTLVL